MSLLVSVVLALGVFALAVAAFRLPRALWSSLLAALALGLAGYAWQASPDVAAAPKQDTRAEDADGWQMVEARKEMVAEADRSRDNMVIFADGLARQGQYANASVILEGVVEQDPEDFEAWLALGIALAEHADGFLTPAALHAFSQAEALDPQSLGPGYFVGLAMIRQGALLEAREAWRGTLEKSAADAAGRDAMAERLERLDELLEQAGVSPDNLPPVGTD